MRLLQEFHYDVWGKREYSKVYDDPSLPAWDSFGLTGRQGFTGHEMLDNVGLIHMNGRVYDPELARFVSADPKIPDPYNSQAFNRYTYVYNNPLSFIDPDGFEPDSIHLGGFLDRDFYLSRDGRINWRERGVNNEQAQRDLERSNNNNLEADSTLSDMSDSEQKDETSNDNLDSPAGWLARTATGEFNVMRQPYVEAFAWVARNRVESSKYPNTYKGVVLQNKQFSSWNEDDPNYGRVTNPDTESEWFKKTFSTISEILNKPESENPFPGALHYYSPRSMKDGKVPNWAKGKETIEYKDIKSSYMTIVRDVD